MDPDAFNLGNGGLTEAEERTYFGLWCLFKAPLLMGQVTIRLIDSLPCFCDVTSE